MSGGRTMTDGTSKFEALKASIEQLRDEINVKAHLGKAEARDALEELETKWSSVQAQYKSVANEAGKTAQNTRAALRLVADELKQGYERIRKRF
jgi:archaellum component FlaC